MSDWYDHFEQEVILQLKGNKRSDLRFFRIEEYLSMAEKVDILSSGCRQCSAFRHAMDMHRPQLKKAVEQPGRERRELDRLQSRLSDHLRKDHGFYPASYFTYRYSFFLTIILLAVAAVCYFFSPSEDIWYFFAPAFAVGVVAGQIAGGKKDRKVHEAKKTL